MLVSFWDGLFSGAMLVLGSVGQNRFDTLCSLEKNTHILNLVQGQSFARNLLLAHCGRATLGMLEPKKDDQTIDLNQESRDC